MFGAQVLCLPVRVLRAAGHPGGLGAGRALRLLRKEGRRGRLLPQAHGGNMDDDVSCLGALTVMVWFVWLQVNSIFNFLDTI